MNAYKLALRPAKAARVEIIPLIDVVFFLLATFVLFTLSLNRLQSLEVTLPRPGDKTLELPPAAIQVSGEGTLYWDREPLTLSELPARIRAYQAMEKNPRVMVSGDEQAHFGATVRVLDELRKADITKFSVETRPRATGR